MLEANCPKCGSHYYGWALRFPRNQYCSQCGTALNINEDESVTKGYSPFEAEEYIFGQKPGEHVPPEETKNAELN
jgi:hypothetical protein